MPLTGLGVALLLERLLGLHGKPPVPPGLYLLYQLLEPEAYFARFHRIGGQILALDDPARGEFGGTEPSRLPGRGGDR